MKYELRPGSDEAIEQGCICPVLDNGHGKGCGWVDENGDPLYWINGGCPLHDLSNKTKEEEK